MATRFAFVLVVLSCLAVRAASLIWTGAENREWNTTATNWGTVRSNYVDGDSVFFRDAGRGEIFIGSNGTPMSVMPSDTTFNATNFFQGSYRIRGGDIMTGAITVTNTMVEFAGYSNSLSFPGGLNVLGPDGWVTFDLSHFSTGASVHLGEGPITLASSGRLNLTASNAGMCSFENDITGLGFAFVGLPEATNAAVRFTGVLTLNPRLHFTSFVYNGTDLPANEIAGPVIINQESTGARVLNITSFAKDIRVSGVISDGAGPATNAITLDTYYGALFLTASNTYSHGTRLISGAAPKGPVTVLPGATLGTGDVDASLGMLVLTDAGNISRSASLKWGYQIVVTNRAKVRVASAIHIGTVLPHGVYTSNSPGLYILGDGSLRTPGTNIPPTVVVTAPTNGAAVRDDDIVRFRVEPADVDGFIERVDFYLDGVKVRTRTNAPYSVSFTNMAVGEHVLWAAVFDDDGGSVGSGQVRFQVRTRLTPTISTNGLVVEFPVAAKTLYTLQMTPTLSPPAWSNVMSVGAGSARLVRYTNGVSPPPDSFYRVITP